MPSSFVERSSHHARSEIPDSRCRLRTAGATPHAALGVAAPSPRESCAMGRPDDRVRGKGIASPDQPREPKQSWRPQGPTGLDVRDHDRAPSLLNPDSEQAGSRSCVGRDRTDGRRDLDQVAAARLGRSGHLIAAAISAAPFRPDQQRRPASPAWLLTQAERKPPSAGRAAGRRLLVCTRSRDVGSADRVAASRLLRQCWRRARGDRFCACGSSIFS